MTMNVWNIVSALIVAGVGGYLAYLFVTELFKTLLGKKKPKPIQKIIVHGRTYCGVKDRHIHYKINTIIHHNGEQHLISYYYCPLTHRIRIIMPKPRTADEVRYDEEFEAKSDHMGE